MDTLQPHRKASSPPPPEGDEGMGVYVYCIIGEGEYREFGPIGIGEEAGEVYTLSHGNLSAVVSETPIRVYDPTRENVLAHEQVNKTVMEDHTVIPMAFGTIFRTEADITAFLESTSQALEDVLRKMENKIELGLKVLWDRDRVVERLEQEHEEIGTLKDEIARNEQGSTYLARVHLGRMTEQALEDAAAKYLGEIYGELEEVAVASRSNKLIGDQMILNAAYLVDRSREEEFAETVRQLGARYDDLLSFTTTGPWPPYNFVNIKLKLERAER